MSAMPPKVAISDTGKVTLGITVAQSLRKKRKITSTTSTPDPTTGVVTTTAAYNNVPTTGGYAAALAPLLGGVTSNGLKNAATTILSAQDVNVKLRALMQDQQTNTTSYPRMVTLSNREVAIRAVVNQPVLDASSTASSGSVGSTTTTKVAYLPIGTVLNILPKRMQADKVLLNMAVNARELRQLTIALPLLLILVAFLMVSTWRFWSSKSLDLRSRQA